MQPARRLTYRVFPCEHGRCQSTRMIHLLKKYLFPRTRRKKKKKLRYTSNSDKKDIKDSIERFKDKINSEKQREKDNFLDGNLKDASKSLWKCKNLNKKVERKKKKLHKMKLSNNKMNIKK